VTLSSTSTINLPYKVNPNDPFVVIRLDSFESVGFSVSPDGLRVKLKDIEEGVPIAMGMQYDMKYKFGPAALRTRSQDPIGSGPRIGGRLQVIKWRVFAEDTSDYTIKLEIDGVVVSEVKVPRRPVGGSPDSTRTDEASITVKSRAERARVVIASDSWLPSQFTGAEWEGFLTRAV